jgi:glycosyltransferase involved in cell wall biosynthesis
LRRKVVEINPDLVHANSIRAGLVATAATLGLGTRVVWHLHDLLPRHPLSSAVRIFAFLFARARMIAVSQAVADNFAGPLFSLRNRVSVILNGIDLDRFQANKTDRKETRQELKLDEDEFVVGLVGLLTRRKGQLGLIHAFARVLREVPKATLLIVGGALFNRDEEYAKLLRDTAAKLGISERVRFLGVRSDVPAVMQSLDLLVVNSSVEPFGLVLLEGMACATPILAAISGGIPELIQHGSNGWLVPQGQETVLADEIVHLARHPEIRARLAEQGRQHVISRFAATNYLEQLQGLYETNQPVVLAGVKATVKSQPGEPGVA